MSTAFTLDVKDEGDYLWQQLLPWQLPFPWLLSGSGQIFTLDVRN